MSYDITIYLPAGDGLYDKPEVIAETNIIVNFSPLWRLAGFNIWEDMDGATYMDAKNAMRGAFNKLGDNRYRLDACAPTMGNAGAALRQIITTLTDQVLAHDKVNPSNVYKIRCSVRQ